MLNLFQSTRMKGWTGELLFQLYKYKFKITTLISTTMKIIKEVLIGLVLILVCNNIKASTSPRRIDLAKFRAMNTYINAVVHGRVQDIKNVIDDNAHFSVQHGKKFNTVYKPQVLRALRSAKNIEQNCSYRKSIVWEGSGISVQKVRMKYPDFTRTDRITLQRAGSEWKITNVEISTQQ